MTPASQPHTFFIFPLRVQRGVSMETRKRQRSVSQPKVHPVREGGSAKILQQAGCEWDDAANFKGCFQSLHFLLVKAGNAYKNMMLGLSRSCCSCLPLPRPEIPKRWWKLRPLTPPSNRPRLVTLAACRSPTWKTTAQGTSLSTTVMLRYTVTHRFAHTLVCFTLLPFKKLFIFYNAVTYFLKAPCQVLDYTRRVQEYRVIDGAIICMMSALLNTLELGKAT